MLPFFSSLSMIKWKKNRLTKIFVDLLWFEDVKLWYVLKYPLFYSNVLPQAPAWKSQQIINLRSHRQHQWFSQRLHNFFVEWINNGHKQVTSWFFFHQFLIGIWYWSDIGYLIQLKSTDILSWDLKMGEFVKCANLKWCKSTF